MGGSHFHAGQVSKINTTTYIAYNIKRYNQRIKWGLYIRRTGTLKALIFGIYSKVYSIYGISKFCERTKINNTRGQTILNFYNSLTKKVFPLVCAAVINR